MRPVNRLSVRRVETLKEVGRHADGAGLYLHLDEAKNRRWVFVFQWQGKRREMGLGSWPDVSLADARDKREDARKLVAAGIDPIQARKAAKTAGQTFGGYAEALVEIIKEEWSSEKLRARWLSDLKRHAAAIWTRPLADVNEADVLAVLRPIWTKIPVMADKIRGRIERVLDAAKAEGLRTGDNPARWKGHLEHLLSQKVELVRGHHTALDFRQVPALMARLRSLEALSARCLEWTILTAVRTGEALGARKSEIEGDVWTIPAERMKGPKGKRKEHRVALNDQALAMLPDLDGDSPFLFPGLVDGKPLSNMAMLRLLKRMEVKVTVHGFRSTFKDWASETTETPNEISEAALAHKSGDKVERSYRRGDVLDRRRRLMQAWGRYCMGEVGKVVKLRG